MDLLFEIGTEELPPLEIEPARRAMARFVEEACERERLEHGPIRTYATPRRLALSITGVAPSARDREELAHGPSVAIAFDDAGEPTKAALGFARGKGVDVDDLLRVDTPKGEYIAARLTHTGRSADAILTDALNEVFSAIPWKRSMRWGWSEESFARPIHWIVALLGDDVLSAVSFAGIRAGRATRGHRFLSPDPIELSEASDYEDALRSAYVEPEVDARKAAIRAGVQELAKREGIRAVEDEALVDEVCQLVEWPVPLLGHFDEKLLEVPREVLVTSMRSHQRYFAFEGSDGDLVNAFAFIGNMIVEDPEVVIAGNRRVLRARLEDARFFYREDRKRTLVDRLDDLERVIYIDRLGTLRDRADRLVRLAEELATRAFSGDAEVLEHATRAALLCKCDLTTAMVYEFPDLQGTMGRYYARNDGEPAAVARAIEEHYKPRGASDGPATTNAGAIVALADKIDAIVGCFAIDLSPSGSADPYGLRRAALGILRTIVEHDLRLDLELAIGRAFELLPVADEADRSSAIASSLEFVKGRLRAMLSENTSTDTADAVIGAATLDVASAPERAEVLERFRSDDDFNRLTIAFKRVVNILDETPDADVDPTHFESGEEEALWEAVQRAGASVREGVADGDWERVARELTTLKEPVDAFFDNVLVNAEDERVRTNRLALLTAIRALFFQFADISRVQAASEA